jgi:Fe-S oxidoreductase
MEHKALSEYEDTLYGCRFCPMCKPASEVGSLTQLESHSTRGRALQLWRVVKDLAEFTPRDAQLIYQSTLDSISQAWCINHYPVAEYLAAARRDLVGKGLVPQAVKSVLEKDRAAESCPKAETVVLAGEIQQLGDLSAADPLLKLLAVCGMKAEIFPAPSGAVAYALGDVEAAGRQAAQVVEELKTAGVRQVVADGPQTLYALKILYPLLGADLPKGLVVSSPAELVEPLVEKNKISGKLKSDQKIFFHDSRSACFLADELATDEVIQPEFSDREEYSGSGEVYEKSRQILDKLGVKRISSVWSKALSKSSGADDGLMFTYPELAAGLAEMRLDHIRSLGATAIVTDSWLDAAHLRQACPDEADLRVFWFPEILKS